MDGFYDVARHLEATGAWNTSLTVEEHLIYLEFLDDREKWLRFMNLEEVTSNIACTKEVLQMLALRARAMLFETQVPRLYRVNHASEPVQLNGDSFRFDFFCLGTSRESNNYNLSLSLSLCIRGQQARYLEI